MSTATVGALRVVLGLDSAAFTDGLSAAQKHLKGVGRSMQQVGMTMATVGAGMTAAITAPLIAAGFAASKAATEAADAMGQVESALASMGDASGRTKEQLAGLADGLMRNSLYDDDDILRKVTANLLTFGNVSGEAFDRAQQAAVNLSARLGQDLQSSAIQVGKALNDPIKGITALSRVGVSFTEAQKSQIKAMTEAGNVAGAQGIILAELERQYGGAAAAAQATDPYDKLRDSLNLLSESAGGVINRFLIPMTNALAGMLDRFSALSPQMQTFMVIGAAIAAALGPALVVIGALVGALGTMATALATGGVLAGLGAFVVAAAPFIAAAAAIAAVIYIFRDELGPVLQAFGKAIMEAVGPSIPPLMAALQQAVAALEQAFTAFISLVRPIMVWWAGVLVEYFGPKVVMGLRILAAGFTNAFDIIGQTLRVITALLKGDWSGAWNAAGSLVGTMVLGIGRIIDAVFPGALAVITRMVDGIKDVMGRKLVEVFDGTIRKVRDVSDAFFRMYDAVVGHSYVPDMVEGVAAWMAKLDAGMVVPAVNATDATRSAFESLRNDVAGILESLLTDAERAARQLATETGKINALFATGRSRMTRGQADQAIAGLAGQNLTMGGIPQLGDITQAVDFQQTMRDKQKVFDDAAARFADQFASNMERVLRGDIKGVFLDMLQDTLRASLSNLGTSLFKSFGTAGGGLNLGKIGSSIASLFGGFKMPGFKTGGSFWVGGAGGADSQTVAFRASPGEMVDIRKPGQTTGNRAQLNFDLRGAVMTTDLLQQMQGMAAQSGGMAFNASRSQVPADLARQQAYRTR